MKIQEVADQVKEKVINNLFIKSGKRRIRILEKRKAAAEIVKNLLDFP